MSPTRIILLTLALLATPLQAAEPRATPAEALRAAPIRLAAATDPMVQIRRDQYWAELEDAFKAGDWGGALGFMRKLDALGVDLPVEYAFMKAKALLETGDAAGAEEQAMRYLRQAGAGGAHYKEALRLLTQAEKAKSGGTRTFRDCAECPEMVIIPAGRFDMGANDGETKTEQPVHGVRVAAFALGKTEVTQAQWTAIMGSNPSNNKGCDDCPVEEVNWHDANEYLSRISAKTGKTYRLPSEAEWEYACRAGGRHTYCGSDRINDVAWYEGNSGDRTQSVARKQANAWGVHDMSGNVKEWVQDCWNNSYNGAPADGSAWTSGNCGLRMLRGGSWLSRPANTRAANRAWSYATDRGHYNGFRPARIISP